MAMSVGVSGSFNPTAQIRLTVDGNVIAEGRAVINNNILYPVNDYLLINDASKTVFDVVTNFCSAKNCEINFKSSLKIEMLWVSGSTNPTLKWQYETE